MQKLVDRVTCPTHGAGTGRVSIVATERVEAENMTTARVRIEAACCAIYADLAMAAFDAAHVNGKTVERRGN